METYERNGGAYKAPVVLNLGISGGEGSASTPLLHYRVLKKRRAPISAAARSKAWAYVRSLAGIAGSNPVGRMDVCVFVSVLYCHVEVSAMGRSLFKRSPTDCSVSVCDRGNT